MTDILRILLILALAGVATTAMAAGASWWLEEDRRLSRLLRRVLGGEPDAQVVAPGRNAAAGFRLDSGQAAVMWDGGARTLLYPLSALEGAELLVDDVVAARAFRGEPRQALDAVNREARHVVLRLVFDNPRDPDFELALWPPTGRGRHFPSSAEAIAEARSWIARAEAILRRPAAVAVRAPPPATELDELDPEEDDEPPF